MNHFWFKNENDPCSLSEASLFFYLLYEANRQHWVMPFKVSTQMLVARLNTSKQIPVTTIRCWFVEVRELGGKVLF